MSDSGFLHRHFLANGGKPINKWAHYFDIYEHHLARFRDASPVMLEIGVGGGGSLAMWKAYFGPGATILGLDIREKCNAHEGEGVEVFIGDQSDPSVIAAIIAKHPRIDIVLDDGSHQMADMGASFDLLYPSVSPTGVYILEDMHTCYWEEFGGGLRHPASFMERVKGYPDEINAAHSRGAAAVTDFTRSTWSISVYDSIVVFEKRPQGHRQPIITRPMPR